VNKQQFHYAIDVSIAPRPATRPRFSSKGQVYNDPSYKAWLKDFSDMVRKKWDHDCLSQISHIEIVFHGQSRRGDLDNYLKACLDGLVYSQVIKNDNLGVLNSIETNFVHAKDAEPWILIKIFP
tara:strand:- start:382 stop:753 length:372 start_codon:yes stop_codon:yes gene_type:complete